MDSPRTRMYTHPFFEATPPGAAPGPPVKNRVPVFATSGGVITNALRAAKQDKASTAARIPRSQVFPGGRGRYEQTGRLLRGTWACGRGPSARGSEIMGLGSKLG